MDTVAITTFLKPCVLNHYTNRYSLTVLRHSELGSASRLVEGTHFEVHRYPLIPRSVGVARLTMELN